eukprot:176652-Prymnesium_polylepis.1
MDEVSSEMKECTSTLNCVVWEVESAAEVEVVLDKLVTMVEKLSDKEVRETKFIDCVSKRSPIEDERVAVVLRELRVFLRNESFAKRMCDTGHASHFFASAAKKGTSLWPICFNKVLQSDPTFPSVSDMDIVCATLVRWGTYTHEAAADSSFSALRTMGPDARSSVAEMDGLAALITRRLDDSFDFTSYIFDLLDDPKKIQVVELAFARRANLADTLFKRLSVEGKESVFGKLDSSKKAIAVAKMFESEYRHTDVIFDGLSGPEKIQVYLKLTEKEKLPNWNHFNAGKHRLWELAGNEQIWSREFPGRVGTAYKLYEANVLIPIHAAFQNNPKQPHMETLVGAAFCCGLHGPADLVLKGLAPHAKCQYDRLFKKWDSSGDSVPKRLVQERRREMNRAEKAWQMLLRPEERIKKQFEKALSALSLAASPSAEPVPLLLGTTTPALPAPTQLPTAPAALAPAPARLVPAPATFDAHPSVPPLNAYLHRRVLPRTDCVKCAVARGPDASVRELFAMEGGIGRVRNPSLKRACPMASHAISASADGVPLVEEYELTYGIKVTNKKQKFQGFMQTAFGVQPLGKAPHHKVTLYNPPHVKAHLSTEDGVVKIDLASFGYTTTSEQGSKDNYMGFLVV